MDKKYKIAIIGGKLQGTEAAYLAQKAGFYSILFDKNPDVPASGLCDEFVCSDICSGDPRVLEKLLKAHIILPAMENIDTIRYLEGLQSIHKAKVAFDFHAYAISSSKWQSNRLFDNLGIPAPVYYPESKPPYVAKPSSESGSAGVRVLNTVSEAEQFLSSLEAQEEWIVQEQLAGPSYSLEIIGRPGAYRTYQITEIHIDESYDCNRVTCPCPVTDRQRHFFEEMAYKIAEAIGLHGIMDLEVIDDKGVFKILEIDARIPSQTPTAVYYSTGINLLSELVNLFEDKWDQGTGLKVYRPPMELFTSYEHYYMAKGHAESPGEHIMGEAGPLKLYEGYLGSDELITDYKFTDWEFRATLINSGRTLEELELKRNRIFGIS